MPVVEKDIERIGVFRRLSINYDKPPEGYEPILSIEIPIDIDISDLRNGGIVYIRYKDEKPEIIDKDTKINVDDKLMQILSRPFTPTNDKWVLLNFDPAQLDCSKRMLMTFEDELLDTMLSELDGFRKRTARLILKELIKRHDVLDHPMTLIHPETKTGETKFYPSRCITGPHEELDFTPLSVYWHELWAVLNELRILDTEIEREDLKETYEFVKRKIEQRRKKVKLYEMVYKIIYFFKSKGLTLNDMLKVLEVPIQASIFPDKWLCFVLLDLAKGVDPSNIPYESSYYDAYRAYRKIDGVRKDYDFFAERRKEITKNILRHPWSRIGQSIHEVVVINEDTIRRMWFCLKPKLDITEVLLKLHVFYQECLKVYAGSLIPTTINATSYYWFVYHEKGLSIESLFEMSMNAKISSETLFVLIYTSRGTYDPQKHYFVARRAWFETLRRLGFRDNDDLAKWLGFKDINEYKRWENSVVSEMED